MGRCPDAGPYSEVLHGSCVACDHQYCSSCRTENLAGREGAVLDVGAARKRA